MADDIRRTVGLNVRSRRKAAGLTQEALAVRCGFSQHYLSGLERGIRNPTVLTVFEMAQALQVPAYVLLMDES